MSTIRTPVERIPVGEEHRIGEFYEVDCDGQLVYAPVPRQNYVAFEPNDEEIRQILTWMGLR